MSATALELFWAFATGTALVGALGAFLKSKDTQAALDLQTNIQHNDYNTGQKDHAALERVVDTQTKRLNDHYSAVAGLRAESRRQRSELRQLTRTLEAVTASHGRQSAAIGELIKKVVGVAPKKGSKK